MQYYAETGDYLVTNEYFCFRLPIVKFLFPETGVITRWANNQTIRGNNHDKVHGFFDETCY